MIATIDNKSGGGSSIKDYNPNKSTASQYQSYCNMYLKTSYNISGYKRYAMYNTANNVVVSYVYDDGTVGSGVELSCKKVWTDYIEIPQNVVGLTCIGKENVNGYSVLSLSVQ